MANRYFFDKRDIKHNLIKYGIGFGVAFVLLIGLSFALDNLETWARILIYIAILVADVILCEVIDRRIKRKKAEKEEQRRQEEKALKKQQRKQQQLIKRQKQIKK